MNLIFQKSIKIKSVLILLLDTNERNKFLSLMGFQVVSLIFELIGLMLLFALIRLTLMNDNEKGYILEKLSSWFLNNIYSVNFYDIVVLAVLFYILSAVSRIVAQKKQFTYAMNVERKLGGRLYKKYLLQEYLWHKNNHSSMIAKSLLQDTSQVVSGYVLMIISTLSNIILIVGIFIIGVLVSPYGTISIIGALLLFFGGAFLLLKNEITNLAKIKEVSAKSRYRFMSESMSNIADIYINGMRDKYLDKFDGITKQYTNAQSLYLGKSSLPSIIIENFIVIMILVIVLLFSETITEGKMLSQLTFLLILITRLLPATNRVSQSISQIQYTFPLAEELSDRLRLPNTHYGKDSIKIKNKISLSDLSFSYKDGDDLLNNVNLEITLGDKVLISGSSGAGKSTLMEIIMGLLSPDKGEVKIDGVKVDSSNILSWYSQIAYVPQRIAILDASIKENIIMEGSYDEEKWLEIVEICDLSTLLKEHSKSDLVSIGENGSLVSGGQRQRIGIARALYRSPKILFIDEATSALDHITEKKILKKIMDNEEITVIGITHNINNIKQYKTIIDINKFRAHMSV